MYELLTVNLSPKTRQEELEGRSCTVVPMVMAVEGVLNGSRGPLYYPADELAKTPYSWNYKPIVVTHPMTANGQSVTACSKEVLESSKIGVILNAVYADGKLKAEAWIDNERAKDVDIRVLDNIANKTITEVSTGLAVDFEEIAGDFNGTPYSGIARNFRPDHLAVLPDDVGACSVAAGAGLLRNQSAGGDAGALESWLTAGRELLGGAKITRHPSLIGNAASFDDIRQRLKTAVKDRQPLKKGEFVWIIDIYPTEGWFVYEHDLDGPTGDAGPTLLRLPYQMTDGAAAIPADAQPVEVRRTTTYLPVTTDTVMTNKQESTMDRNKMIANLLEGPASFSDADKPALEAMTDTALTAVHNAMDSKSKKMMAKKDDDDEEDEDKNKAPAAPVKNESQTAEEYISNAPQELQEVLSNGLAAVNAERAEHVAKITGHANNQFTPEALQAKPLAEVRMIANLLGDATPAAPAVTPAAPSTPAPNFSGQGGTTVANTTAAPASTPLTMPPVVNAVD